MTSQTDYQRYYRLKTRLEKEIETTMNKERYAKLMELQKRCFPTKEQVVEEVERFYAEEDN